jgi:multimeric flavodoxin WrbA
MKVLLLDGSQAADPLAIDITRAVRMLFPESQAIVLRDRKIGNCAGDFLCWVRSPGVCNTRDDNRVIAAKIIQSDLVIYTTPVTFGGYSSALKKMVDHQIQYISPFFATINGEVHHRKRYRRYPNLLAIGWMDAPDGEQEAVFRHLVRRNAINMYAKTSVCGLVVGRPSAADLDVQIDTWLNAVVEGSSSPVPALPIHTFSFKDASPVRRAVLLVGSPRTCKSTSASLGGFLLKELEARGIEVQTVQIYHCLGSRERINAMHNAIDSADLVVLAFPLYVDSLPAPVIAAMEGIARRRKGSQSTIRFAAIANCGFPGSHHNHTALAICSQFARQCGLTWMGGLSLGAGEGVVHGRPLAELDGRAVPLKASLSLAADALAKGDPVPQSAMDRLAKPSIPKWAYTLMGQFRWASAARRYGMQGRLRRRPYLREIHETQMLNDDEL